MSINKFSEFGKESMYVCMFAQISTDLNISNGIMSFNKSSYKFLVPGSFGNPKQYFNFCLGLKMQEP
jgi:hypothetical protein